MFHILKEQIRATNFESWCLRRQEGHEVEVARDLRLDFKLNGAGIGEREIAANLRDPGRADREIALRLRMKECGLRERDVDRAIYRWINQKSRPANPKPEWEDEHELRRWNLHQRRALEVRAQARIMHLAYGFLRGVPYHAMERICYTPPPWQVKLYVTDNPDGREDGKPRWRGAYQTDPVQQLILKHATVDSGTTLQRLAEWHEAAGKWEHPHRHGKPARKKENGVEHEMARRPSSHGVEQ